MLVHTKSQSHRDASSIDRVSPCFCAAKWKHLSLHLETGLNHSCYHPTPHPVARSRVTNDPRALHNTPFKKAQRKMMLDGVRPPECSYCWDIEDLGTPHLSDRYRFSREEWAYPHIARIANMDWNANVAPSYLEVSFSNVCNLKCSYCSPTFSSAWMSEAKSKGPFPTSAHYNSFVRLRDSGRLPIEEALNPYIDAFWRWWPELKKELHTLRITGGEPLLSRNTFRLFEDICEGGFTDIALAVNSNLCVDERNFDKFRATLGDICLRGKVKKFTLFASLDAIGRQAEYIRSGLDYERFVRNLCQLISMRLPRFRVVIMCTINALNVSSLPRFQQQIVDFRRDVLLRGGDPRYDFGVSFSHLRHPSFMSAQILPTWYEAYVAGAAEFAEMHKEFFVDAEVLALRRTQSWMKIKPSMEKRRNLRRDFGRMFQEHDRRRKTNFEEVFPEMLAFWKQCVRAL